MDLAEVRDPPRVIETRVFFHLRQFPFVEAPPVHIGFLPTNLSLIYLACLGGSFVFYDSIAAFEEGELEQRFSREYMDYRENTPKWIPRLRS
jgi:protein-S-isoprenylcysteine O-methyltransferase Ste14